MLVVREARETDIPAISAIYSHYVRHETVSFEIDPPDQAEMARRRSSVLDQGLPYLVAELRAEVAGYAYAGPYRPRKAYRFTLEHSIYVDPRFARQGCGHALMQPLIETCRRLGYRQLVAVIGGSDNLPSIRFHESLGFQHAGTLRNVGYKFDRWLDSVLMQLAL
jgi:phosphinothricin acetyltransferase